MPRGWREASEFAFQLCPIEARDPYFVHAVVGAFRMLAGEPSMRQFQGKPGAVGLLACDLLQLRRRYSIAWRAERLAPAAPLLSGRT